MDASQSQWELLLLLLFIQSEKKLIGERWTQVLTNLASSYDNDSISILNFGLERYIK